MEIDETQLCNVLYEVLECLDVLGKHVAQSHGDGARDEILLHTNKVHKELQKLVGCYEPTEIEQGLIPIPDGYAEQ